MLVKVLPQTKPEDRAFLYEDVETLLAYGFLTHPVKVGGVPMQMRSLTRGDLFLLRARTAHTTQWEWRLWAVATSIWMINGWSLLGQDAAIPVVASRLRKLPWTQVDMLFTVLMGLWARVGEAVEAAQVYCYEVESRYRWKSLRAGGERLPGSENLGANAVQRMWVAYNEMEDQKRAEETAWEGFKLVASSNAPQAISKMDKRDEQRREEEANKRQKELDLFYYRRLKYLSPKEGDSDSEGFSLRVSGPKSVDQLEDEMRRWVTGDADEHDTIVNQWKADLRASREAEKARRQQHQAQLAQVREKQGWDTADFRPQPLMALSADQLQRLLSNRPGGHRPGIQTIYDDPQHERVYQKYVVGEEQAGALQVVDGKLHDPQAQPDTDKRTLNALIQGRNPAFNSGG